MKKLKHITEICREIYEKEGFAAVCDYVNKILISDNPMPDVGYEYCKACDTDAPEWNHICLACGQPTELRPELSDFEKLREQAQELIDLGDSHEKAEGRGMMIVLNHLRPMPNNLYFELMAIGKNKDLDREEIQIHAGENGNIMIVKTPEGFVIDVYGQNDLVDTMAIWEDTLNPPSDDDEDNEPIDPNNWSLVEKEDFIDEWGQYTDEVCAELGYDEETSDDLLMVDYFYHEESKKWIPKCSSLYTPREQSIADYLRLG